MQSRPSVHLETIRIDAILQYQHHCKTYQAKHKSYPSTQRLPLHITAKNIVEHHGKECGTQSQGVGNPGRVFSHKKHIDNNKQCLCYAYLSCNKTTIHQQHAKAQGRAGKEYKSTFRILHHSRKRDMSNVNFHTILPKYLHHSTSVRTKQRKQRHESQANRQAERTKKIIIGNTPLQVMERRNCFQNKAYKANKKQNRQPTPHHSLTKRTKPLLLSR